MGQRVGFASLCLLLALTAKATDEDPFSISAEFRRSPRLEPLVVVRLSIQKNHYLYADQFKLEPAGDITLRPFRVPKPKLKHDRFLEKVVGVFEDDLSFAYVAEGYPGGPIRVEAQYQGCSDSMCFLPQTKTFTLVEDDTGVVSGEKESKGRAEGIESSHTWRFRMERFRIAGRAGGYMGVRDFLEYLDAAEAGGGLDRGDLRTVLERKGVWLVLLLIVGGGLLLNLTPCVLPMIPINIAIIGAGAQAGSRGRGLMLGATYGAGIAAVYGALGVAVVLSGSKFGTLNSSPWFNIGVAAVFILLAMAMFGLFNIDFTRFQAAIGPDRVKRGGFAGVFLLGGVAALLAGACVAPVVISVLVLSAELYARGNAAGLLLPFLLGIGMALPWPFAGAGLSFLPKPGRWMEIVKYGFGIVILAFAVWYGYLGYSLLKDRSGPSRALVVAAQKGPSKDGWFTSVEEVLIVAERERKPVFVDFWASWCKNCLKMEKTTFNAPEVKARLDAYVKLKYRAENLRDPATREMLDHFGVVGLPTYVVLQQRN